MAKKSARKQQQRNRQYQKRKQLALAKTHSQEEGEDNEKGNSAGQEVEEVMVLTGQMGRVSLDHQLQQQPVPTSQQQQQQPPQQQQQQQQQSPQQPERPGREAMPTAQVMVSLVPAGLSNMGNTCYFNSVMQIMGQTYLLHHLLTERCPTDYVWNAKTFYLREKDGRSFFASEQRQVPLHIHSSSLVQEFLQLQSKIFGQKSNNPRMLLAEIRKVNSQFAGWSQQDSQELLIALLDALKKSESRRQVDALIKALDISDPKNASDEEKSRATRFKIAAKHTVVDAVFGGQLLSIIHCATCGYRSFTFEPFIDLSLSLNRHFSMPTFNPNRKRNKPDEDDDDEVDTVGVSKPDVDEKEHKLTAKERKLKRQEKKAARREARKIARSGVKDESWDEKANGNIADQEISDDDEEEKDDVLKLEIGEIKEEEKDNDKSKFETEEVKVEKDDKSKSDTEEVKDYIFNLETEVFNEVEDMLKVQTEEVKEEINDMLPLETNVVIEENIMSMPETKEVTEETDDTSKFSTEEVTKEKDDTTNDETVEVMEIDCVEEPMTNGDTTTLEAPILAGDGSVSDLKDSKDGEIIIEEVPQEPPTQEIESDSLVDHLLNGDAQGSDYVQQKYQQVKVNGSVTDDSDSDDEGTSIKTTTGPSCLSQIDDMFRAKFYHFAHQRMSDTDSQYDNRDLGALFRSFIKEETLDGPNKYLCESCSKRAGCKMYSRAVRCQLIALPPPVLILHLKRFEASGFGGRRVMQKLTTSISFPERFYLAPYTSRIYEYFSRFYEPECDPWEISDSNEHRLEYRLYGVVIHSGSLRCGHYMAYVCVRPGEFHAANLRRFLHLKPFVSNIDHILSVCYQDFQHHQSEVDSDSLRAPPPSNSESTRKWYFVSDSSVSPTTLDSVLRDNGSPYLLFYERTR